MVLPSKVVSLLPLKKTNSRYVLQFEVCFCKVYVSEQFFFFLIGTRFLILSLIYNEQFLNLFQLGYISPLP